MLEGLIDQEALDLLIDFIEIYMYMYSRTTAPFLCSLSTEHLNVLVVSFLDRCRLYRLGKNVGRLLVLYLYCSHHNEENFHT